jgi:hypothetical protein
VVSARIYSRQGDPAPVFVYRREEPLDLPQAGRRESFRFNAQFLTPEGGAAVTEEYEYQAELDREVYRYTQHQTGEAGVIERQAQKVRYRFTASNGRVQEDQERASEDWTVGPVLVRKLQSGWDRILRNDSVPVRIAVPDRQESFGFRFTPDSQTLPPGKDARGVRVLLEARSPFIRVLVSPIEFWMAPDGKSVRSVRGRTLLKIKKGSSFEDLDGFTEFM